MPKVSEFLGISIYVYWRDHAPPQFHAVYGERQAIVGILELRLLGGELPPRALGLVMEWATRHQPELKRVWEQAQKLEPLDWVDPLG